MVDRNILYFQQRAEEEVVRAQAAIAPEAVRVHWQLAAAYLERLAAPQGAMAASRDD